MRLNRGLELLVILMDRQQAVPRILAMVLILSAVYCSKVNAQEVQEQIPAPAPDARIHRPDGSVANPASDSAQAFQLSASQHNILPPPQVNAMQPQFVNQGQPQFGHPAQAQFRNPAPQQYGNPGQPQFGYPPRPQFRNQAPIAPTRVFSAAAASHSGPGLLNEPGPLAYDLTLCQDDPNFHPPYLVPRPEILNPGAGFGESGQNVRQWQAWADHVAMASWTAWRQHALPEFGCAEIDITLNRDGTFKAKRGTYRYYSPNPDMPVEQAPFLLQLNPFLKYLQDRRVFRIPDSINMNGAQTIEFQIQLGVRQKDRANPYSWCGFMKDWQWWTGTGLQVYHGIECDLNGLGKK